MAKHDKHGAAQGNGEAGTTRKAYRRTFDGAETARTAGPAGPTQRLFQVGTGPGGAHIFVWTRHPAQAYIVAAQSRGWQTAPVDKVPNKEALAAGLAALSDEDRAILIARYMPAPAAGKSKK
jgi:hypothetical protein